MLFSKRRSFLAKEIKKYFKSQCKKVEMVRQERDLEKSKQNLRYFIDLFHGNVRDLSLTNPENMRSLAVEGRRSHRSGIISDMIMQTLCPSGLQ